MAEERQTLLVRVGLFAAVVLITLGIFASNNWFPRTDAFSGKRYGWFGTETAPVLPSPTPQLSREYVYAGSRLLAVEDANASAAPPADLAVWRPSNGTWYVLGGPGSQQTFQSWGQNGDTPIPGDFDGDGKTDFSVFRPGTGTCPCAATWYIINSGNGSWSSFQYAMNGDLPAQADYDGDGRTDPAVYRPPTGGAPYGVWYIQGTSAGYYFQSWGEAGDIPASADYDGDGRADIGVFRPSNRTFYSIHSSNSNIVNYATGLAAGTYDWQTVSSDYDGDGRADHAVYDQTTANWYIKPSSGAMTAVGTPSSTTSGGFGLFQWGAAGDIAVQNDYDGDAKTDLSVWTPSGTNAGRWHIKNSSTGSTRNQTWGITGDIPVPAFFRR
ncbi:MAG: VCBS repeat-containing protein [Acidobacteria bacterium]|nr:VCBS repeat-containing protein [Acidobacteriota bacterium]